jgi:CheY-like chemotaxis protein
LGCEPPRLLIVDDNPANLEIMEARLARQGYEIVTATDGDTALAQRESDARRDPVRRDDAGQGRPPSRNSSRLSRWATSA